MINKKNVLIAMSGGIDSSVAAILLKEQGYKLTAVTFRVWDYIKEDCLSNQTGCCDLESIMEAKKFAENIGIEHHILDIRDTFKNTVIKNFIQEYMNGKTPNPCIVCNSYIKWGEILKFADKHNCTHVATGHYANIEQSNNRYFIKKGKDSKKDQSYFLWNLRQSDLKRTLFPLGRFTKDKIRNVADKHGFKKLTEKPESQEICFIPDNDYRRFLRENADNINEITGKGNFVSKDGEVLGEHKGFPFYTIGQRKGLGIALGKPAYVININPDINEITIGDKEDLLSDSLMIKDFIISKYKKLPKNLNVQTKIRYRSEAHDSSIEQIDDKYIKIKFKNKVSAVTKGQSAVFYENDDLIGGGIIC